MKIFRYGMVIVFDILLLCMAKKDWKERKIKNRYPALIILISVAAAAVMPEISGKERILGMLAVSVPISCIGILAPGSFGGGDAKLSFACGAFLGKESVVRGTVTAIFLAGIYSVRLLVFQYKRENSCQKQQFAFGPFLCAGYVLETCSLWIRIMENL